MKSSLMLLTLLSLRSPSPTLLPPVANPNPSVGAEKCGFCPSARETTSVP